MSERLAEIRERLEKVTPVPWEVSGGLRIVDAGGRERLSVPLSMSDNTQARHDADFAANAPMDIAFLLDELETAKLMPFRLPRF